MSESQRRSHHRSCTALDDEDVEEHARIHPAPAVGSTSPSRSFCALLSFIAEKFDPTQLDLEVKAKDAAWGLFEDNGAAAYDGDEVGDEWKVVYEWHLEVGRALADVFGGRDLQRLSVETSIWDGMGWVGIGPRLTAQITATETVENGNLPRYHDACLRLLPGGDGLETD